MYRTGVYSWAEARQSSPQVQFWHGPSRQGDEWQEIQRSRCVDQDLFALDVDSMIETIIGDKESAGGLPTYFPCSCSVFQARGPHRALRARREIVATERAV